MTNEEAIEHLKNIAIFSFQDGYTDEARKALDMAIEALQNSPTPMSGTSDLISRDAAIDAMKEYEKRVETAEQLWTIMGCKDEILKLPSAQPERKTGKWIEVNDAYNRVRGRCSICGWESHMYEDDVVGMDYCPNCGARLEAE